MKKDQKGYARLSGERRRIGFTQQDMSDILGYASRNAYSMKERGVRRFSVEEAICIAHHFGTPVEQLFAVQDSTPAKERADSI